jgi:hypothetical protein
MKPVWGAKFIWIDSVCINQADAVEKSQQVSQMDQIYHGAARVTAWLGHADDALMALLQLYRLHRLWSGSEVSYSEVVKDIERKFNEYSNVKNWRALCVLLTHPY